LKSSTRVAAALVAATGIAASATVATSAQANAEITVAGDARRKINLAGRQRMLTQFMARATCFAKLKTEGERQKQDRISAMFLFEQTLMDLRAGSPVQEMLPETDSEVLASLDKQGSLWKAYQSALAADDLAAIQRTSEALLTVANETVTLIEKKRAPAAGVDKALAAALNISGRQRMLIQRSVKSFCYVAAGFDPAASRTALKASLALFDSSLEKLRSGDSEMGLLPPPVAEIGDQLTKVAELWAPLRAVLLKVADGQTATQDEILMVAINNLDVLEKMNAIVELYQELASG
jgi:hypothetical protein